MVCKLYVILMYIQLYYANNIIMCTVYICKYNTTQLLCNHVHLPYPYPKMQIKLI